MAKFTIATPAGPSYGVAGGAYDLEREGMGSLDAEIREIPAGTEDDFIAAARNADALYAKGRPITKRMIDGMERCKIIALGSVGVDSVDVAAATARGIPVTNVPDTFIEEVADHAMMLILATFRRLVVQDRMVREGRWKEGRPQLLQIPRLMGQTLGFIAFGHVARAVAMRARAFGVRMLAYDPYIEELVMSPYGVEPASLSEVLQRSDIVTMHAPATPDATRMMTAEHFRQMKPTALFINTGRGPTVDESALVKALQEGWIAGRRPRRAGAGAAGARQPASHDGQRDPDRARGLGLGALRSGAAAAGGARDLPRAERALAAELRQSHGPQQRRPAPLAAVLDGARAGSLALVSSRAAAAALSGMVCRWPPRPSSRLSSPI